MRLLKKIPNIRLLYIVGALMLLLAIATQYYGSTDIIDYAGVAKFFAGDFSAKIRSSHSMLYGMMHAPLVKLINVFLVMKITSVIWLFLLVASTYYISGKNHRVLALLLLCPVVWYSAPWISPIQLASLLFLWGWYHINKYQATKSNRSLLFAGILFGLAWAFWNTILFLLVFIIIIFFYDKKMYQALLVICFIILGFMPTLVIDYLQYGFPFYSTMKFIVGTLVTSIYGGIYSHGQGTHFIIELLSVLILVPLFSWKIFSKKNLLENPREKIFLILSLLLFCANPQIRYLLIIMPLLILSMEKTLNERQYKIQLIIFIILTLIVITSYIVQIKYSTISPEFTSLLINGGKLNISPNQENIMRDDLHKIALENPNSVFIVGPNDDDYAYIAMIYDKKDIKEFVSIQDYELYKKNQTSLFEKKITFIPKIADRRELWIAGGLEKSPNDLTNYSAITNAVSINLPLNISGFTLEKKYQIISLYKKIN